MSTYSVTLDHNSPVFHYYPFGDSFSIPDLTAGWAPWTVDGGFDPSSSNATAFATSHRTALDGAILELYFRGTSLTLFGQVDNCEFDIWLDGVVTQGHPGNGRLADLSPLDDEDHRMLLTAHPSENGSIAFRGALLEVELPNEGVEIDYHGVNVTYGNDWSSLEDEVFGKYHQTARLGASVSMNLQQTSAVVVYGLRGLEFGRYNVTLDNTTTTYIAKSSFQSQAVLFAAANLDTSVDHQLVITNIEEGEKFAISSVNVTTAEGGTPPSSGGTVPKSTLVAVVAACVSVLAFALLIFGYVYVRRRMKVKAKARKLAQRQYSAGQASIPTTLFYDHLAKSLHTVEPFVMEVDPRYSYGSFGSYGDSEPSVDEDDASYHFVRRPLIGSTPSLRRPDFGPEFKLDFNKAPSDHMSRNSSKRSHKVREAEEPMLPTEPHHERGYSTDQTDFLHLQDTSGSTDRSKLGSPERHRGHVRFSTPAFFKPPSRLGLGVRSHSRASRETDPMSPLDSEPFTGTSISFAHPESTPPHSQDGSHDLDTSQIRDHPYARPVVAHTGFIPQTN